MKFLVFNLAVAAALVFLFTADRGAVQRVAGRMHDAAAEVKDFAAQALDKGQTVLTHAAAADNRVPSPVAETIPPVPASKPDPAPAAQPAAPPVGSSSVKRPDVPPAPPAATPPHRTVARARPSSPPLDPAVAERRREVLEGIATTEAAPRLKDGARMMAPAERRRELLSLAEEMEMLYARSVGR